jgi:hypothetical protein
MTQAESPHRFVNKSIHAINNRKVTPEKSLILFKTPGVSLSTSKRPQGRLGGVYWTGNLACCSRPGGGDERKGIKIYLIVGGIVQIPLGVYSPQSAQCLV